MLRDNNKCLRAESPTKLLVNILKFLVIGKAIEYGGPANPTDVAMVFENLILPSIEIAKEWEDKKMVVGGLFAGQRAGVFIAEASTGEELSTWLQRLPFWSLNTWEIIPLQSFASGVENVKQQLANVKKMAEMLSKMPK
jgi:hypothetical protein